MKEFKIYLAGGMKSLSWDDQCAWRELIEDLLHNNEDSFNFKYKLDIINPTMYYNFKEKRHDTELEVMKYDLRHVKTSDLIIVNFNDPTSIGTASELAIAYDKDIPIIGLIQSDVKKDIHPWLINFCDKIFTDINKLTDYVMDFYLI